MSQEIAPYTGKLPTEDQRDAIVHGWTSKQLTDEAFDTFYPNLFALDPSLQKLFKGDQKTQAKKLFKTVDVVVKTASKLDSLIPTLVKMGKDHVGYQVTDDMYSTVATALIKTLSEILGDSFTPEVKEGWVLVYGYCSHYMLEGAKQARAQH
eukprot:TRINITY_DN2251_c0_g1_i1.p1 TRINITY_DN2251_c0_g1~~TRINITY_DN2251_c0_g1_i1.p1  ORF type:complete len:168 (+),score=47.11 TRINITY_DN2251_c0_g1_i1:49-504(+)